MVDKDKDGGCLLYQRHWKNVLPASTVDGGNISGLVLVISNVGLI